MRFIPLHISCFNLICAVGLALWQLPVLAANTPASTTAASAQDTINALTRAQAAVVGVQVIAADGARSAQTLGKERGGSGVVISARVTAANLSRIEAEVK